MKQQSLLTAHIPQDSHMKLAMRIARNFPRFRDKQKAEEAWYGAIRSSGWYKPAGSR